MGLFEALSANHVRKLRGRFQAAPVKNLDRRPLILGDGLEKIDIEDPPDRVLGENELSLFAVVDAQDFEPRVKLELDDIKTLDLADQADLGPGRDVVILGLEVQFDVIVPDIVFRAEGDDQASRSFLKDRSIEVDEPLSGRIEERDLLLSQGRKDIGPL